MRVSYLTTTVVCAVFALVSFCTPPPETVVVKKENLFPEGLTFGGGRFVITSLREGIISEVKDDGSISTLVDDPRLISAIGAHADEARDRLIVCNSDPGASVKTDPKTQKKVAAIGVYDLKDGTPIQYIDLAALNAEDQHFCNDIAIASDGTLYVTNSFSPVIYKVTSDYKPSILVRDAAFEGQGFNLNGIVISNSGYLIVAKMSDGDLYKVTLTETPVVTKIQLSEKVPNADGLLWDKDGNLVIISNGDTNKVFIAESKDDWKSGKVLTSRDTGPVYATTGVLRKGHVYFLEAQLDKLFGGQFPVNEFTIRRLD